MKLDLFIEKNYLRFYKYFIAGRAHKYFYKGKFAQGKKVVFYLHDKKVFHLGDTLWFEPIARFLSQYYSVVICPNPTMRFYFTKLGYSVINADEIDHDCILITLRELMYKLRKYKHVLYLNFDYRLVAGHERLIDSMLAVVARFFNLPNKDHDAKYDKLMYSENETNNILLKFNLNIDSKYIIFNNYIDSWGKNTTIEMLKDNQLKLVDYANEFRLRNPDVQFLYVGSNHDLEHNQEMELGSRYIDLRGKTTIEDLFMLVQAPLVVGYIGFDTFLLHLFNMYDKPSYILLKPGQSQRINKLIINHVLVPYPHKNNALLNLI